MNIEKEIKEPICHADDFPAQVSDDDLRGWLLAAHDGDAQALRKSACCLADVFFAGYLYEALKMPDDEGIFLIRLVLESVENDTQRMIRVMENTIGGLAGQFENSRQFADCMLALFAKWAHACRGV